MPWAGLRLALAAKGEPFDRRVPCTWIKLRPAGAVFCFNYYLPVCCLSVCFIRSLQF